MNTGMNHITHQKFVSVYPVRGWSALDYKAILLMPLLITLARTLSHIALVKLLHPQSFIFKRICLRHPHYYYSS